MNAQIEISQQALTDAMAQSLFKGELGEQVAAALARLYAEVTTYNRTDAAKLLNIARTTLYEYERGGSIRFHADGRVSLAELLDFRKRLARVKEEEADQPRTINRKPHKQKRSVLKK